MSRSCKKIICVDKQPKEHSQLFFGEYGNFIRIDKIQFPQIKTLYESSESNVWFMNEIDYGGDIVGWEKIPPRAQRMFKKNIGYQTLMDSGVSSIFHDISKVASVSELQYLYNRIGIEENIHSLTYSNGLNIVFGSEAEEILNEVYSDDVIKRRMDEEIDGADEFLELCINDGKLRQIKRKLKKLDSKNAMSTLKDIKSIVFGTYKETEEDIDEKKKALLKLLAAAFLLEGVKFPFSFYVTWAINKAYGNAIQGFSRALKLIAWDEMTVHSVTGSTVLNILRKDESQGFKHLFDSGWFDEFVLEFAERTAKQEMDWSRYLLQEGSIPGFNEEIGDTFIKYWVDKRLKEIKVPILFNEKKSDIVDWFNKYRDLNGTTTALQEADATNYQKGKLMNDMDKFDKITWDDFVKEVSKC